MTTITNWTNITTVEGMLNQANANSPFWLEMLVMIWVVLVITFMRFGVMTAILGGSFLTFVLGLFLVYMGLFAWQWLLMIIAVMIATIIYDLFFGRDDS